MFNIEGNEEFDSVSFKDCVDIDDIVFDVKCIETFVC